MKEEHAVELLVGQVDTMWRSVLCGSMSQHAYDIMDAMKRLPRIGELVVIQFVGPDVPAYDRIGWLESIEEVPSGCMDEDEGWAPSQRIWMIKRLDGKGDCRWTNVSILRVIRETKRDVLEPVRIEDWEEES